MTVGHRAVLHGCTIGDCTLIGMGAVVLNRAVVGSNCIIGAGALVTECTQIPDNSLVVGAPARVVRDRTPDTRADLVELAARYTTNSARYCRKLSKI
ncbi:gamma carbonic anhydrase family protein [Mesorhizobium sp. 1B3]|uniref:gamma carbonic anhydrase family protein n=1 Tax=Mesorhizobium sp. 1B3 TaxID=3243599 RepID=UPI003D954C1D